MLLSIIPNNYQNEIFHSYIYGLVMSYVLIRTVKLKYLGLNKRIRIHRYQKFIVKVKVHIMKHCPLHGTVK